MIAKEGLPRLQWPIAPRHHVDRNRASLDRPALQQLLADVRAGKIDIVLVYKVDRLTRSLADFATTMSATPDTTWPFHQRLASWDGS
jgi:DNA invertase Pin-like site-specific DNA recombinase